MWGSGLDTLLTALRDAIQASGGSGFPAAQLQHVLALRGKSLTFETAEIEYLLHMEYGDKRVFPLLSLLFPFLDLRNQFHVDHVYPFSRFTTTKLQKLGYAEEQIEGLARHADSLANLQLLEGPLNNEKRATMPSEWLVKMHPDPATPLHYRTKHELGELPASLEGFEAFYAARVERLRGRLNGMLGAATPDFGPADVTQAPPVGTGVV